MIDCNVHNTRAPARRDLEALFCPASVAVVGASDDPMKWGNWLARGALRGAHRRAVYLVSRRGGDVLGEVAHTSLAALPEAPELVVLVVPGATLEAAVDDAIAAGARAIVAISAGAGNAGGAQDAALARRAREAGVVLIGPNCLGVSDAGTELELVPNPLPAGPIGLLSQSGNLALEAGILAAEVGLGFSRFVSLGNQVDTEAAELVRALAAHAETRVIALYLEDFRDGRAFAQAAADAAAAGKPVVLLTVAHTAATARAARSHTGALASDGAAIDAACHAAGTSGFRASTSSSTSARRSRARACRTGGGSPCSRTAAATAVSPPGWRMTRAWSCPTSPTASARGCARRCRPARHA
jgi:acyl-CoA synthetase (NDP forming)